MARPVRGVRGLTFVLLLAPSAGQGAEGALSHYLPGTAGDFGLAIPPEPGLQLANITWYQTGSVDAAVIQGTVDVGLDVDIVLDLVAGFYTFDTMVLGATVTAGIAIPFGYARLEGELTGPAGNRLSASADSLDLSDIAVTPVALNWSFGAFSLELGETIIAPTGGYDIDEAVNLGRNYWSFDSYAAATWFDADTGTEASIQPGIMLNTRNDETDYKTGAEFHVDFVANQFLSPTFALGVRGYYYQQVTGDSGSGAILGDFESEAVGLGGGFVWSPASAGGRLAIAGRAMTDVHARNRFEATYGQLTLGWRF